ncbi:MAG: hypothetical protein HYV16_08085 [Gammaproteobacteria bacterium]|nr:hypothetical protein [Gammaproteobacteria bacterium]
MNIRLGLLLAIALPLAACASDRYAESHSPRLSQLASQPGFSYAVVAKGGDTKMGSGRIEDWKRVRHHKAAPKGEYLWFVQGGLDYVVTDAAVIAQARAAMRPMLELGERMNEVGERMSEHGETLDQYGAVLAERDRREAAEPSPTEDAAAEARLEEASEAMSALSKDMEALNERHERAAAETEAQIHALTREALAAGQAKPLPR